MSQIADQIVVEIVAISAQHDRTMNQVADSTDRNMAKVEAAAEKAGATVEKVAGTVASRLPDLIRNLGDGQNALHLFLQEGAVLAPAFGPWGVVIGAASATLDALIASLGGYAEEMDAAEAAATAFSAAMDALKGALSTTDEEVLKSRNELSLLQQGYGALAGLSLSNAIETNNKAIAKSFAEIKENGRLEELLQAIDNTTAALRQSGEAAPAAFAPFRQALTDLLDASEPTLTQLNQFVIAADNFKAAYEPAAGVVDDIKAAVVVLLPELAKQALTQQTLDTYNKAFTSSAGQAAEATKILGQGFINAVIPALEFGRTIQGLTGQLAALSNAKPTFGLGSSGALSFGGKGTPTLIPNAFPSVDLAELEGPNPIYDLNNLGTKKSSGAGAAAKQGEAIDKSNLKIQQQIDLNTRLIAVYTQGDAARERARAQYDAESEALARGLKYGTDRYNLFVKQRTANAEWLRLSNLTLADFAKGEALTKASMNALEAYNVSLNDLNRLHDEGAINAETYSRQLFKLKSEYGGYAEGLQAVAQAIQGGIQGATSFSDALIKIGIALGQLIVQAAALGGDGGGPLGKLFDAIFGTFGGLLGSIGGGSTPAPGIGALGTGGSMAAAYPSKRAAGGQALPGQIYQVGETGREWFAPSVPGQVIPNSAIKNAAGGGGGSGQPITFNISMAGANGDRAIAEIASAAVKKGLQSVPEINRQHAIRFA
ncbi:MULTISPECIES: hypothetical protein [Inquilinus]|uniref:Bacteriophage tail tape measure C-terminal domain-containing protein n=1 Tax=Inquilinus ginsengisoli TaxID=363840 RepID=A0ABU1JNU8_9PROT|nr:hypothetical protein [Inquilinus ginsengisoli]MDR6289992.1 hypothetical protein [Inquilinus ginsengisoli]